MNFLKKVISDVRHKIYQTIIDKTAQWISTPIVAIIHLFLILILVSTAILFDKFYNYVYKFVFQHSNRDLTNIMVFLIISLLFLLIALMVLIHAKKISEIKNAKLTCLPPLICIDGYWYDNDLDLSCAQCLKNHPPQRSKLVQMPWNNPKHDHIGFRCAKGCFPGIEYPRWLLEFKNKSPHEFERYLNQIANSNSRRY